MSPLLVVLLYLLTQTTGEVAALYNDGTGIPYEAAATATFTPRVMVY